MTRDQSQKSPRAKKYAKIIGEALIKHHSKPYEDKELGKKVIVTRDCDYLYVTGKYEDNNYTTLNFLQQLVEIYCIDEDIKDRLQSEKGLEKLRDGFDHLRKHSGNIVEPSKGDNVYINNKGHMRFKLNLIAFKSFLSIAETDDESKNLSELNRQDLSDSESTKRRSPEEAKKLEITSNNGEDLGDYLPKNSTAEISKEQLDDLKPYFKEIDRNALAWAVMEGISVHALKKWIYYDCSLDIESFWEVVLKDFRNKTNGTPSLISVLKTLVHHPKIANNEGTQEKIIKWLQRVKPGIDLDKPIDLNQPVKAYLLVAIEQNFRNDPWFVKAELKIENYEPIPLDVPLEKQSSDRYSLNVIYPNNSLEQLIPQYIEKLLDRSCSPYLRGLPSSYKLLIEIFLPFDYLAKSVDLWLIDRKESSQRKQKLGKRHRVIVRSYDRIKNLTYFNELKKVWQQMEDIDQQDFGNLIKSLEKELNYNYKNLENELRQQLCIGLSCLLPETKVDQEDIFDALLMTGVPLALWLRSRNIEGDYREDFDRLLCPKCLQQDCEGLIDEIFKKRQQLPNNPQEAKRQWGYHAALLLDNPDRIPSLNPLRFG